MRTVVCVVSVSSETLLTAVTGTAGRTAAGSLSRGIDAR